MPVRSAISKLLDVRRRRIGLPCGSVSGLSYLSDGPADDEERESWPLDAGSGLFKPGGLETLVARVGLSALELFDSFRVLLDFSDMIFSNGSIRWKVSARESRTSGGSLGWLLLAARAR